MNLLPLAERLQNKKLGRLGKTIFVNMLPIDTNMGVLLRNRLTGTKIDYELKGYVKTSFQLIVRSPEYDKGELLIQKVTDALTVIHEDIGKHHFNFIRPHTEPTVFPLSEGNLLEFSTYFDVCYYEIVEEPEFEEEKVETTDESAVATRSEEVDETQGGSNGSGS